MEEINLKKSTLESARESLEGLDSLFGSELTNVLREKIEDLSLMWERIHKRLSNRTKSMKVRKEVSKGI